VLVSSGSYRIGGGVDEAVEVVERTERKPSEPVLEARRIDRAQLLIESTETVVRGPGPSLEVVRRR
jgi:hypothetical protein